MAPPGVSLSLSGCPCLPHDALVYLCCMMPLSTSVAQLNTKLHVHLCITKIWYGRIPVVVITDHEVVRTVGHRLMDRPVRRAVRLTPPAGWEGSLDIVDI